MKIGSRFFYHPVTVQHPGHPGMLRALSARENRVLFPDRFSGMRCINLLYFRYSSESFNLALNIRKQAGILKHGLPGIRVVSGHVIVCMVAGDNHQGPDRHLVKPG